MTFTEHLDAIAEKLGVDYLPDRLLTTYLEAFAKNQGVDVSSLQDRLVTTYLAAILNARGGNSVSDNLVTTYLEEIAKTYGVDELVDNMIATYLKEIADAIEGDGNTGGGTGGEQPEPEPEPEPEPDVPTYDKYSWEGVAASIDAGTYKTDYAIGDTVPLDLGSEGVINMQIVAFDADTLTGDIGTAAISFLAMELLATKKRFNPAVIANSDGTYQIGTGCVGGYASSELCVYVEDTIGSLIPNVVKENVVSVSKTYDTVSTTNYKSTQYCDANIWIPSRNEVWKSGGLYNAIMPDNASRRKKLVGTDTYENWWYRDANSNSKGFAVSNTGAVTAIAAETESGVCIGFCVGKTPS